MADFKAIMTLAVAGRSYDEIAAAAGCSRRDVAVAKRTIAAYGFTAGQIGAMSPQEIARLFPDGRKRVTESYERPDFDRVLGAPGPLGIDPTQDMVPAPSRQAKGRYQVPRTPVPTIQTSGTN